MTTFDDLKAGVSADTALAAFRAGCNQGRERLFIAESWFGPREARLRAALPSLLTPEVAAALREAVLQTRHIDTVIDWLEQGAKPWPEYETWRAVVNRRLAIERMREGYFPWPDVDACRGRSGKATPKPIDRARHCPQCGATPNVLTWVHFVSPPWTWESMCGRAGWLTVCDPCGLQIDFFMETMN